ncbi:MAG: MBL fold metallo-hydrolase [Polyangiaceae bacterium]|jgi:ribonuclease Z|nr:MBL fold metallo-hydrolase [Polyangiaceae bacterium]
MALYQLHNPGAPIELHLSGLRLIAFSISGVASYVLSPAFDACFDLGHCALEAVKLRHVFLSHVHQDHSGGVHRHLSLRRMFGARPSRVFAPAESAARLEDLLRAYQRLEEKDEGEIEGVVRGVAAGEEVRLSGRYRVRAFDVRHRIASRGYTVIESKRKLKPAFEGAPGEAIAAARARGEEVHDTTEVASLTYVGDSTLATLLENPHVGQSEVLFLEATHLPGTSPDVSERWGHTHLAELAELAAQRPEIFASRHIVLKHFSTRYERDEIMASARIFPEGVRERLVFLV